MTTIQICLDKLESYRNDINREDIYQKCKKHLFTLDKMNGLDENYEIEKFIRVCFKRANLVVPDKFKYVKPDTTNFHSAAIEKAKATRAKNRALKQQIISVHPKPHFLINASTTNDVLEVGIVMEELPGAIEFLLRLVKSRPNEKITVSLLYRTPET